MSYQQRTLAQLQARMVQSWDESVFWTDAEARRALNESLRLYNLFTGFWKKRLVLPTVASGAGFTGLYYQTSSQLVMNLRMTYNDLNMTLGSIQELNFGRPNWRGELTTDGADVPTRPMKYIPLGLDRFAIWPRDAAGGGALSIDGVTITPVLTNPADFVDLGQEEELALIGEALHIVSFKEGGPRWKATLGRHRDFLRACVDRNSRLASSSFFRNFLGLDREKDLQPLRGLAKTPQPPQVQGGSQ